ncbi:MAG: PorV/PorQ family protein, partial [Rhodothermales bacterium]|nr:PorV/PorQ family protein [Rhodothermales bacterium]
MKMKYIAIFAACFGLMLSTSHSANGQSRVGTTAAPFLTLGTGAKGQSLGSAYTTMAVGADAVFWNPAGAARGYSGSNSGSAFFTHHEWLADINYNAAAVVVPVMGSAVIGLGIAAVDYGDMVVRTVAQPEGTGETFSSTDLSLGLTYAQPLTTQFYFGGTVKYVRQQIRDMSATGVAFDLGFVLETRYLNGLQLAASIQNFGTKLEMRGVNGQTFVDIDPSNSGNNDNIPARLEMDSWDLPLYFKFGASLPVFDVNNVQLRVLAD